MTGRENFRMALRTILGIAAFVTLGSCGESSDNAARPSSAPAHETVLNRGNGAEVESLDPALADTSWEQWIIGDMMMGLFTEDAAGNAILGVAENAVASPDGKTWTFI